MYIFLMYIYIYSTIVCNVIVSNNKDLWDLVIVLNKHLNYILKPMPIGWILMDIMLISN